MISCKDCVLTRFHSYKNIKTYIKKSKHIWYEDTTYKTTHDFKVMKETFSFLKQNKYFTKSESGNSTVVAVTCDGIKWGKREVRKKSVIEKFHIKKQWNWESLDSFQILRTCWRNCGLESTAAAWGLWEIFFNDFQK